MRILENMYLEKSARVSFITKFFFNFKNALCETKSCRFPLRFQILEEEESCDVCDRYIVVTNRIYSVLFPEC